MIKNIEIERLSFAKDIPLPSYNSNNCSGLDLYAANKKDITIKSGKVEIIPSGIKILLKKNLEGQIRPRSGLAKKFGITVLNSPGTIDEDYRGEIKIILINLSKKSFVVKSGDRVAQMILCPVAKGKLKEVKNLPISVRSKGGFGSTGK